MSEQPSEHNENLNVEEAEAQLQRTRQFAYHWNYVEQASFDRQEKKIRQKNGVIVYTLVLVTVFVLCLLLLAGTVIFYQAAPAQNASTPANYVSQMVAPATVFIKSTSMEGYGYGTGFFITSDGFIVTNYHVVRNGTSFSVTTYDGAVYEAELVGGYPVDDIAVLKIEAKKGQSFSKVTIGSSNDLSVGDVAVAVGNPGGTEAPWTVTQGIISSLDRTIVVSNNSYSCELRMIQTDASLNSGNSGGPLCNANGEVIAIVTRKLPDYEGISFAIPIDAAMHTVKAIMEDKLDSFTSRVSKNARPAIGFQFQEIAEGEVFLLNNKEQVVTRDGLLIVGVTVGSGAYGFLREGDVLFEFDGVEVHTRKGLQDLLLNYKVGEKVQVRVVRNAVETTVTITLGVAS